MLPTPSLRNDRYFIFHKIIEKICSLEFAPGSWAVEPMNIPITNAKITTGHKIRTQRENITN